MDLLICPVNFLCDVINKVVLVDLNERSHQTYTTSMQSGNESNYVVYSSAINKFYRPKLDKSRAQTMKEAS